MAKNKQGEEKMEKVKKDVMPRVLNARTALLTAATDLNKAAKIASSNGDKEQAGSVADLSGECLRLLAKVSEVK